MVVASVMEPAEGVDCFGLYHPYGSKKSCSKHCKRFCSLNGCRKKKCDGNRCRCKRK
nr:unnamed protein product [Callosobruchus chinensis]CAH7730830.1 unnamed protein product [Callosobruchus chinensis]